MRQAGRYLPEYRAVREKAGGFLDLCFNPELAAEVTLQPVRRFGFDAAILFSDILVVPLALGRKVWFVEGEGPRLEPLADAEGADVLASEKLDQKLLAPIYETVRRVKSELGRETTLIGFCGAPWTVATYMVAGQGTPDQAPAKNLAAEAPEAFQHIDRLPGRCFRRLSGAAIGSRRRCGADFRYLGGIAAAAGFRTLVHAADQTLDRETARATPRHQSHRLSARRGQEYSALCR